MSDNYQSDFDRMWSMARTRKFLGISQKELNQLLKDRRIPSYVYYPDTVRFEPSDIEAYKSKLESEAVN